jgi:rare lipoprotein A
MTMRRSPLRAAGILLLAAAVGACGPATVKDGAPRSGSIAIPDLPPDAVPRPEPKSRYGNGPVYEVLGEQYTVMPSSAGYKERGVASWYGTKFHGNLTSMREPYDMYAMTAAHKTLPLPTYVRVRNLRNDKTVVVRVNDRGPFAHNRIIDLSYSAALKLDMVRDGTTMVEVEALGFDGPEGDRPVRQTTAAPAILESEVAHENTIYAQVGAFGDPENAARQLAALRAGGIGTSFVVEDTSSSPTLYRVRIGPIRDVTQYDLLVEELEALGISEPYLVTE